MAQRFEITLIPKAGTNVHTNASDDALFNVVSTREIPNGVGMTVETADTGGYNFIMNEKYGEISKCDGELLFSTEAMNTTGNMQALEMLYDGTNRNLVGVRNGKFYRVDSDRGVTNIDNATPVTFHTDEPMTPFQYGAYIVLPSLSVTPQKWKHGDSNLTALINAGGATAYKFKYMEQFKNCIIGAYSDQTNGNIDIRYTDPLPDLTALSFPVANQLYKPDNDIGITGIKRMGNVALLVYGDNSILSMDYYPDYTPLFQLNEQITGIGPRYGYSIVDTGDSHIFFDENKGFIQYLGGKNYKIISDPIEPWISTMAQTSYKNIVGTNIYATKEVAWTVPLDYSVNCNAVLYYNTQTGQWRKTTHACNVLGYKNYLVTYVWTDFILYASPDAYSWPIDNKSWGEVLAGKGSVYYGKSDGFVYEIHGDDWSDEDYEGCRIEPIFAGPNFDREKRLQEVHVLGTVNNDFLVDVYWRGGNTEQEVKLSSWEILGNTSQLSTSSQVVYCDKTYKYHQLKIGTDKKNEKFRYARLILKGFVV